MDYLLISVGATASCVLLALLALCRRLVCAPSPQGRVFQAMSDAAVVLNTRGRVVAVNPAGCAALACTTKAAIGRTILELLPGKMSGFLGAGGLPPSGTIVTLQHDGERIYRLDVTPLASMFGHTTCRLVVLRDIAALRRGEQALARAEATIEAAEQHRGVLLAALSHEVCTPMNGLAAVSDLLLATDLPSEQREYVQSLRDSCTSLLTSINDILDFAKIEDGRLELEQRPFHLRGCIEAVLDLMAVPAAARGLSLSYLVAPELPEQIVGDEVRLRQVLTTLVGNAIKFTDHGEVSVLVSAWPHSGSAGAPGVQGAKGDTPQTAGLHALHLTVRATGSGIAEEVMGRLLSPARPADASTARRYVGASLGLAICKRLIGLMGGALTAEGVPGQGSVFRFSVRYESAPHPAGSDEPASILGRRVLVVDDNPMGRTLLVRQLRAWGLVPVAAESGPEALELLRQGQPFDLGIIDQQMPGMDGAALAEVIRLYCDARTTPLILLRSVEAADVAVPEEWFAAVLPKPLKASVLYDALADTFSGDPSAAHQRSARRPGTGRQLFDPEMGRHLPLRILLAEDNRTNEQLALRVLGRFGYMADLARNGREAVEACLRETYDLVLMDVQMPELDGLEATEQIRRLLPPRRLPAIVALTANSLTGDRESCLAAGMDGYLSKPIDAQRLVEVLTRVARAAHAPAAPPSPAETAGAVVDPTALERLRATLGKNAAAVLPELVATFLSEAVQLLDGAHSAVEAADLAALRRLAHTLKSNSLTFGARDLERLCLTLERRSAGGTLEGADELLTRITAEFERVEAALAPYTALADVEA